ncbi:peptidase M50B-like-domain-containing protein [Scleroderma yunnanense]
MPYFDVQNSLYPRDVQSNLTPNATQRVTLIVAGCYVIAIAILWHVSFLSWIIYPFKLLTVGFHEMSHAFAGMLTCATIHSIVLDPDEGGETRMSGGIPWISLPAGYLGSSFIGASLIACGFDTNASLIVLFWFVAEGGALRYFILFIGVMSDLYVIWDVVDDTIARKTAAQQKQDASAFLPVPGSNGAVPGVPVPTFFLVAVTYLVWNLLG